MIRNETGTQTLLSSLQTCGGWYCCCSVLAVDDADDWLLIIDQPEENSDPKSFFDELEGLFFRRRAIIK